METAMLWFNNDPKSTLEQKIHQAAEYYCRKYGRAPELCLINPSMAADHPQLKEVPFGTSKIAVRAWKGTLSHHFWIGVEDRQKELVR